jgi:RNA polymerase sigma-70 factor (ECF subfamily)
MPLLVIKHLILYDFLCMNNKLSHPPEELMLLARQGDNSAYAMLLRSITPVLRSFIARRLFAPADVEDVLQDILLSIHRAIHTYDSGRPFKMWMFAIARHRLNDHLRRFYKAALVPDISFDELADKISAPDVTGDHEWREYLNVMLDTLPQKQRNIIVAMKIEGRSAEETARAMNMSPSAVKVAAHRGYKTLVRNAARMKEEGHGYG